MFGAGLLSSLLLAATASAQANDAEPKLLGQQWTSPVLAGVFEFSPKQMPIDPSKGWNVSTVRQNGVYPFKPPVFDEGSGSQAFTTMAGASMSMQFLGYGAAVRGSVYDNVNTTITLKIETEGGEALVNKTVVRGPKDGILVQVSDQRSDQKPRTLTVTLEEGQVALTNVTINQGLMMFFPDARSAPFVGVNATEFDAKQVNPYYHGTGNWECRSVFEPKLAEIESPHIVGDPGASVTFLTWPNSTTLILRGRHGYEAGEVTYSISPEPLSKDPTPKNVTANLYRPLEGIHTFAVRLLDPRIRYKVTVINTDPERKFKFAGAYGLLGSQQSKNWDPAEDAPPPPAPPASDDHHEDDKGGGANIGAIVGGVVGGVVGALLAAGVAALIWWRRRKPNPLDEDEKFVVDDTNLGSASRVTPMPFPPGVYKSGYSRDQLSPEGAQLLTDNEGSHHRTSMSLSSVGPSYLTHPGYAGPQEADAGPVNTMDTVPPSYNPAWAGPSSSSGTSSRLSSAAQSQGGPLRLHGQHGFPADQKVRIPMDAPRAGEGAGAGAGAGAEAEEVRPEAPPLPTKTKPPGS